MNAIFKHGVCRSTFSHTIAGTLVYPADDHVLRFLREGWFEYREQTIVSRILRPGDYFLDVGAHCGLYSAIAQHRMNGEGTIIAVEPNPALHPFIQQNTIGPTTTRLVEAAVSTEDGEAILYLDDPARAAYATLESDNSAPTAKRIPVAVRTLESLVPKNSRDALTFIKLDVEGVECPILEQASDFLRAIPNVHLMVEVDEKNLMATGRTTADLIRILQAAGFSLFEIEGDTAALSPFLQKDPLWGENLIVTRNPGALLTRLTDLSANILEETQEFFVRGKAAASIHRRSQDLTRLIGSLDGLKIGFSRITSMLSGSDVENVKIHERFAAVGENPDALARLFNDELGRLAGMANAVATRLYHQNKELSGQEDELVRQKEEIERLTAIVTAPRMTQIMRNIRGTAHQKRT